MLKDLLRKFQSQGQLSNDEVVIVEHIIQQFTPATAAMLSDYSIALSSALNMEKNMQTGRWSPQKMVLKQVQKHPHFSSFILVVKQRTLRKVNLITNTSQELDGEKTREEVSVLGVGEKAQKIIPGKTHAVR